MKIPFSIKYRPQIESGEYKVETRDGKPTRIVCWDLKGNEDFFILALVEKNEKEVSYCYPATGCCKAACDQEGKDDLFLVTPEEELTPFEKKVADIIDLWHEDYVQWSKPGASAHNYPDQIKPDAAELLAIAKEQLDIEILKDRAVELTKHLNESGLDENSIEYNLIEFMCNLMDCPNWSEIVETAGLHADRIKAEAVKDLPRWEKQEYAPQEVNIYLPTNELVYHGMAISVDELTKLPGFKED